MTRRKIVGISLPPELEAAAKAHVAALGIGMTEWVRGLITAELRRVGFDVVPLIARLGEGRGKRNDFADERRGRALAQLADARAARREKRRRRMIERFSAELALPAPHAAALLRAVEAEEEAQQRPMSSRRFRRVAALVLAELAARENDAASAAETASGAA